MNKLILSAFVLMFFQISNCLSQPIIDRLYDYQPGNTYQYYIIPQGSVIDTNLVPTVGANVIWDLDALPWENDVNIDSISTFNPAVHSPLYSNCSFVYKEYSGLNQFYRKSNDTLFYMGNSTSNGQYNPNAITAIYPTSYQQSGYKFSNYVTQVPWGGSWTYSGRYNAYGTLKLNGESYSDVGLYIIKGGTPGQYYIDYMWMKQGETHPLVRIQFLETNSTFSIQFAYGLTSAILNVNEFISEKKVQLYPNPTIDLVNLSTDSDWKLFNLNGQNVANGSGKTISMIGFEKGVYYVAIDGNKYKIIKQ